MGDTESKEVKKRILLVEDDPNFGIVLKDYLTLSNYDVTHATDGEMGLESFKAGKFDLCILDVMMPKMDGFTLAKEIKKIDSDISLFFLTAKTAKEDVLEGYKSGANDFLNKPFDTEVLLYKIKAILNNKSASEDKNKDKFEFTLGKFYFNSKLRHLRFGDNKDHIQLSPKEGKLLRMLVDYINDLMPREKALTEIWKNDGYFTSRSMDVYIAKLRKYLREDPNIEIINVHGEGFRLVEKK